MNLNDEARFIISYCFSFFSFLFSLSFFFFTTSPSRGPSLFSSNSPRPFFKTGIQIGLPKVFQMLQKYILWKYLYFLPHPLIQSYFFLKAISINNGRLLNSAPLPTRVPPHPLFRHMYSLVRPSDDC